MKFLCNCHSRFPPIFLSLCLCSFLPISPSQSLSPVRTTTSMRLVTTSSLCWARLRVRRRRRGAWALMAPRASNHGSHAWWAILAMLVACLKSSRPSTSRCGIVRRLCVCIRVCVCVCVCACVYVCVQREKGKKGISPLF